MKFSEMKEKNKKSARGCGAYTFLFLNNSTMKVMCWY